MNKRGVAVTAILYPLLVLFILLILLMLTNLSQARFAYNKIANQIQDIINGDTKSKDLTDLCSNLNTTASTCFTTTSGTITGYTCNDTTIVIPCTINGVNITTIGEHAFENKNLTSITFAPTITTIKDYAFNNNNSLNGTLTITNYITTIGAYAFAGCNYSSLIIGKNLASIGDHAFYQNNISGIDYNYNLKLSTISAYAFAENNLVGDLYIPSQIRFIGEHAFDGSNETNQINKITFSANSNLISIGAYAFYNNDFGSDSDYTTLTLPSSLTSIGAYAFANSDSIKNYGIISLVLNEGLVSIGDYAFANQKLAGNLNIPSTLATIGSYAFAGDYNMPRTTNQLTGVNFTNNDSLTSIGDHAFYSNLITGTVYIPESTVTIGDYAFTYNNILSVNMTSNSLLKTIGYQAFAFNSLRGSLTIGNSVETIDAYAFYDESTTGLTSVTLGNSVKTIGSYAFAGQALTGTGATGLIIPASVKSIGDHAFVGSGYTETNTNIITGITFADNSHLESIGDYAFAYNNLSGALTIPKRVIGIGDYAFAGEYANDAYQSNQLTSLTFATNASLTSIGAYAFYQNKISGSLILPNDLLTIGNYAFATISNSDATNGLTAIAFNSRLTNIGDYAFANSPISGTITIPDSVETIGYYAFMPGSNTIYSRFVIGSGVTGIGSGSIESSQLTTIVNKTNRSFNWSNITSSTTASQTFVTGTITHQNGNITVTSN